MLTKLPWEPSILAALTKAPDVMVIQELPQSQRNVLCPRPLYPIPYSLRGSPEKDSTESVLQSRFGWEITFVMEQCSKSCFC